MVVFGNSGVNRNAFHYLKAHTSCFLLKSASVGKNQFCLRCAAQTACLFNFLPSLPTRYWLWSVMPRTQPTTQQISRNLEAARLRFSFVESPWYLSSDSAALLLRRLTNLKAIPYDDFSIKSRAFKVLRELVVTQKRIQYESRRWTLGDFFRIVGELCWEDAYQKVSLHSGVSDARFYLSRSWPRNDEINRVCTEQVSENLLSAYTERPSYDWLSDVTR